MSSDQHEPSAQDAAQEMEDEAARMQARVDELGEHVEAASKKADRTRQDADLPGDDALDTVSGDAADRTTSSDDPTSAVGDPENADDV
ncbi:MAG: hypothetical protein QOE11_2331 [Solirubrobacteraceae bacterium]|nr:hypothetical protein [Solirubrobacteraceae bacterium]